MSDDQAIKFTAYEEGRIREELNLADEGEHHVTLCPLCATRQWRCTEEGPAKILAKVDDKWCQRCQKAHVLHPEVVEWFVSVLVGQRLLAKLREQRATGSG